MSNYWDRYDIKIIVTVDGQEYTAERKYPDQGCNHTDNLPGTAEYISRDILLKIKKRKASWIKNTIDKTK